MYSWRIARLGLEASLYQILHILSVMFFRQHPFYRPFSHPTPE